MTMLIADFCKDGHDDVVLLTLLSTFAEQVTKAVTLALFYQIFYRERLCLLLP